MVTTSRAGVIAGLSGLVVGGVMAVAPAAPAGAVPGFAFERIAGPDRFATSALVAEQVDQLGGSGRAILANGQSGRFADALAATYLAGDLEAPVLLTRRNATPDVVLDALEDADVTDLTVVGGAGAVSDQQVSDLEDRGYDVERLAGANRYATNAAIVEAAGDATDGLGLVATGEGFADALAAGPLAQRGHPIGLASDDGVPAPVLEALTAAGVERVLVIGGEAAVGEDAVDDLEAAGFEVVERLAGDGRADTSVAVAEYGVANLGLSDAAVDLASGDEAGTGADALSGGVLSGARGRPLLVTQSADNPSDAVRAYVEQRSDTLTDGTIYGGESAVSAEVQADLEAQGQGTPAPQPPQPPPPSPPPAPQPPAPAPDPTTRVSVGDDGQQGNGDSGINDISADGRFVVFASNSPELAPGQRSTTRVYVRDRQLRRTTQVSVSSSGEPANDSTGNPTISDDGQLVVFESNATNLDARDDTVDDDVYVHDRRTGTTQLVSTSLEDSGTVGGSTNPVISGDGRFVAFESASPRLVADDTNSSTDVFVSELSNGEVTRVSVASGGGQVNGNSGNASLSEDGRFVAFQSRSGDLVQGDANDDDDVFVHDRLEGDGGTTTRVSRPADGDPTASGNSLFPSISATGRYVAFASDATDLVAGDTNDVTDVFIHDRAGGPAGSTVRVSVNSAGEEAEGELGGSRPSITADGRAVAFTANAENLVPGGSPNTGNDVYIRELAADGTGRTTQVSIPAADSSRARTQGSSFFPSVSADGRFVSFASSLDLVADDTNMRDDVFVRDRGAVSPLPRLAGEQTIDVAPYDDVATPGGTQRDYTAYGLTPGAAYRVSLVQADLVAYDEDGLVTFSDTDPADGYADLGDPGAAIVFAGGAPVAGAGPQQTVGGVRASADGTLRFTVEIGASPDVVPVVHADRGGDDTGLDVDQDGVPTEAFGTGGTIG